MDGGNDFYHGINTAIKGFDNDSNITKILIMLTDEGVCPNEDTGNHVQLLKQLIDDGVQIIIVNNGYWTWPQWNFPEITRYTMNNAKEANEIFGEIYGDIEELLYIKENCSYAKEDTESNVIYINNSFNKIEMQTRAEVINNFTELQNEKAITIDIDTIHGLSGEERKNAIEKLAASTYVTATTNKLRVKENRKTGQSFIRQINLGLTERPKVEIKTEEEVVGIQLILSDGTILIDTENGLTNYVNAINRKGVDKTISLDNELQQGSTIKIKYKITVTNTGEVDTYGSYFVYDLNNPVQVQEYEETVPTSATKVYSYVNKNMVFRKDENEQWNIVTDTSILSAEAKKAIQDQECIVIETSSLSTPLYPEISLEVQKEGQPSSISTTLILSKVMSTEDATDTLTYGNSIEIVQRYNKVGRRDYIGVPGNYKPNSDIVEYDSAKSESVIIVPPFGEQRLYYILTAIIISIIAVSVVLIKKYVIKNKEKNSD